MANHHAMTMAGIALIGWGLVACQPAPSSLPTETAIPFTAAASEVSFDAARDDALATLAAVSTLTAAAPEPSRTPSITPAPTRRPAPTPEPITGSQPPVRAEGVTVDYDPALASGWLAYAILADDPGEVLIEAWRLPAHTRIEWRGYPVAEAAQTPRLYVIPVQGFDAGYNPFALEETARLEGLLAQRPTDFPVTAARGESIPFLPVYNAGQVIHAQVRYLDFPGGSGVRFLTQYAQDYWPINNRDLFYTFQGISADGAWYISLILPVAHPDLPPADSPPDEEPVIYMTRMRDWLNTQPPERFTPDLRLLDALAASIEIAP